MKRTLVVVLVVLLTVCSAFAGDFKFLGTDGGVHPEIVGGFVPTLAEVGASYEGLSFIDGNLTQLQATVGGGWSQRVLFQNPITGVPLDDKLMIYDQVQMRWSLKVQQGFGDSWVEGKDLITAYAGYEGRYEIAQDSRSIKKTDNKRPSGKSGKSVVPTLDVWLGSAAYQGSIYPELTGDRKALFNTFNVGVKLNMMEDKMVTNRGVTAELSFKFAPGFLNKKASYYSVTLNAVAGTTLYELSDKKGLNLFSVVLLDRINASWTDGAKVPVFAYSPVSLGRKVRGFESDSYNTNFTVVNNLEIRFAGPEFFIDGIFPRLNVFVDAGWYAGNYLNTKDVKADQEGFQRLLCSAGCQLEISFFDFIDLGFQVAYLINGANIRTPDNKLITGVTFFLDL